MRRWFVLSGIVCILLVGGYFALSYYAVKFVHTRLEKVGGSGLTFTGIEARPTYLSVKGIRYEDPQSRQGLLTIDEMKVYPDLFSPLAGTLRIREWVILQPSFFFNRSRDGTFAGPWVKRGRTEKEEGSPGEAKTREGESTLRVRVGQFRIENGSIDFQDGKTEGSPAQIGLRELNLKIDNIQYPLVSLQSPIELDGKVRGRTKDGSLYARGWIDLESTDMETSLKVQEVELKTFEPYYRKRVSAEIESGYINLETMINLKKKTIDAPGWLDLHDLHIKESEGTVFWIPAKTLVSLLKKKEGRIHVKFRVQGNMDDPQFNLQENLLTRIAISFAEGLGIPIQIVGEKVIGGTIKGTGGLAEGLKSLEGLLKKKGRGR